MRWVCFANGNRIEDSKELLSMFQNSGSPPKVTADVWWAGFYSLEMTRQVHLLPLISSPKKPGFFFSTSARPKQTQNLGKMVPEGSSPIAQNSLLFGVPGTNHTSWGTEIQGQISWALTCPDPLVLPKPKIPENCDKEKTLASLSGLTLEGISHRLLSSKKCYH